MKGWRTLGLALFLAVAGVVQVFDWASVVPQDQKWSGIVMLGIAAAVGALRVITNTAVGKSQ